jgi:hypothetical protein
LFKNTSLKTPVVFFNTITLLTTIIVSSSSFYALSISFTNE